MKQTKTRNRIASCALMMFAALLAGRPALAESSADVIDKVKATLQPIPVQAPAEERDGVSLLNVQDRKTGTITKEGFLFPAHRGGYVSNELMGSPWFDGNMANVTFICSTVEVGKDQVELVAQKKGTVGRFHGVACQGVQLKLARNRTFLVPPNSATYRTAIDNLVGHIRKLNGDVSHAQGEEGVAKDWKDDALRQRDAAQKALDDDHKKSASTINALTWGFGIAVLGVFALIALNIWLRIYSDRRQRVAQRAQLRLSVRLRLQNEKHAVEVTALNGAHQVALEAERAKTVVATNGRSDEELKVVTKMVIDSVLAGGPLAVIATRQSAVERHEREQIKAARERSVTLDERETTLKRFEEEATKKLARALQVAEQVEVRANDVDRRLRRLEELEQVATSRLGEEEFESGSNDEVCCDEHGSYRNGKDNGLPITLLALIQALGRNGFDARLSEHRGEEGVVCDTCGETVNSQRHFDIECPCPDPSWFASEKAFREHLAQNHADELVQAQALVDTGADQSQQPDVHAPH